VMDKLIFKAQQGDQVALTEIVEEYKAKVKGIARGYFLFDGDLDDLSQEGMIGLFKAINSFDENKSCNFNAFALMCINREIINCIKKNNTDKNKVLSHSVSLEGVDEGLFAVTSPETIVIDREANVQLMHLIDKHLSKLERQVVLTFIKGFSYGEIGEKLGISSKAVDNALQRARQKLSKILQR